MKTNILSLLSLTALLFAGCATDDLDPGKQKPGSEIDTTGLTAFSMVKPNEGPETRLSGEYTGSGIDFYWSDDDNLFVNTPAEGPKREWLRDKWNNIHELAGTIVVVPAALRGPRSGSKANLPNLNIACAT